MILLRKKRKQRDFPCSDWLEGADDVFISAAQTGAQVQVPLSVSEGTFCLQIPLHQLDK